MSLKITTLATVATLLPIAVITATAQELPDQTGTVLATSVEGQDYMIVTANPDASAAGAEILENGGTAVDAMIAAQTVLGLVEPQSSGLGGGAFVVYYDALNEELTTFDAREKAPAAATEDRFQDLGFIDAWQSGLSVGVPGIPRLMDDMYQRFGRTDVGELTISAQALALDGFELTERTSSQVAGLLARNESCTDRLFFRDPAAFDYFVDSDGTATGCSAKPAGTLVSNPDYVQTLSTLVEEGADAFYTGPIAADIALAVQNDPAIAGDMTVEDLENYEVIERAPVCLDYRGHAVCGMGPPSSGALAVGQILGIMENFGVGQSQVEGTDLATALDFDLSEPLNAETVHLFAEAGRLAFADRGRYVGDTDFVTVPVEGLLDKDYLLSRAMTITEVDQGPAEAGLPPGVFDPGTADMSAKDSGTSHISIIDSFGNALSMTTTIESSFGNGVLVRGFLLNNELTDFSFDPGTTEEPAANRVQPNKRPRSSMSPSIVLNEEGQVELVTGSPGGSRIIGYTAQSIMNHIDFELDPQASINVPHYMNRNGQTDIEAPLPGITLDYDAEALAVVLEEQFGHSGPDSPGVGVIEQTSGLSIIEVGPDNTLIGGADKRRDGTVIGGDPEVNPTDSPPSQPGNVRAILYSNAGGELFWERSTDDQGAVAGYEVTLNGEVVGVFDALSFYDSSLTSEMQPIVFTVAAIDNAGQRSSVATTTLGGATPPGGPTSPANLSADIYSRTAAELFWQREDPSLALRYEVLQDGNVVATTNGVSYFTDSLEAGIDYNFEVIAIDQQGRRSDPASIMLRTDGDTGTSSLAAPADLRSAVYSRTAAELFWARPNTSGLRYEVRRDGEIVNTSTAVSFFDFTLMSGTTYVYEVIALDGDQRSEASTISLTTDGN